MTAVGILRLLSILALCWSCLAGAKEAIPDLAARVTDRTGTLTREQMATLERTLQAFEMRKGSQIAVLIVPTTGEEPIEQYALRAAEQWKLGRKGVDDGALLVVAKEDRALRIEVGYGLEGALNDAISKRIISEIIIPRFQQGDFYGGISDGVERMIRVADGEPLPPPSGSGHRQSAGRNAGIMDGLPIILVVAFVMGGILRAILGRLLGSVATGGIAGFFAWLVVGGLAATLAAGVVAFFITLLSGIGRRRGWYGGGWGGGFGSGGLGGGSFGGGGFRGGGGCFGGGGASGRW